MNKTALIAVLASGLTSTVSSVLTWFAAWSNFSSADNSVLAAIIAAGLANILGGIILAIYMRTSAIVDRLAPPDQTETKVIISRDIADSLPENNNVMTPDQAKASGVTK